MSINPDDIRDQPSAASQAGAVGGGGLAGIYPTQNDTWVDSENCDATHPLNMDFVIPNNYQRLVSARLSFKVRAFRAYVQAVNNPATTSSTTLHTHTWHAAQGAVADLQVGLDSGGRLVDANQPFGFQTATEAPAGGASNSVPTAIEVTGPGHSHSVTPNVSLTYGVFEDTLPSYAITVKLDGADITASLGGGSGFTADQLELDVGKALGGSPKAGFHLLSLQPNGRVKIKGILRVVMQVNPGIR